MIHICIAVLLLCTNICLNIPLDGCPRQYWACKDGSLCIKVPVCNGKFDCPDKSDELVCVSIKCKDKSSYLLEKQKCDGIIQCKDQSDEANCTICPEGRIRCPEWGNTTRCLLKEDVCDGRYHCRRSRADEKSCSVCPHGRVKCPGRRNNKCIYQHQVCDGIDDCRRGADEVRCPFCKKGAFLCGNN